MARVALGIATHLGWASVVAIVPTHELFRVLRTDRIATADRRNAAALEPYHRAAGFEGTRRGPPPRNSQAIVDRGLAAQRRVTLAGLRRLERSLAGQGHEIIGGAILAGRGRLAASLDAVLRSHAQIHVAEGLAARAAFAAALEEIGAPVAHLDQRTVIERAASALGLAPDDLAAALRALEPEGAGDWRQEQKIAALAARLGFGVARR